ncbi:MAG: hypothetical protein ABI679_03125 [Gemmatimonadota bacterium]
MNLDFAVLADYALIDQQGKLSIIGIFQHVWVTSFPTVNARTHLVLRVRGRRTEIGSHTIRIKFMDADGVELMGGEGTVQFGEPVAGVTELEAGAVLVFDIPLPRPGQYAFEIALDGTTGARVPLTAAQVEQGHVFGSPAN